MKCANCNKDAFYVYQITAKRSVLYCNFHVPTFLEQAKKAGLLQTTDALKSAIEDGLKNIVVQKTVEEQPVEEPVAAPKKKAVKKKAE